MVIHKHVQGLNDRRLRSGLDQVFIGAYGQLLQTLSHVSRLWQLIDIDVKEPEDSFVGEDIEGVA